MRRDEDSNPAPDQELLSRAQEYNYQDSLQREDFEALNHFSADILPGQEIDKQIFILGSYADGEKQRLLDIYDEIESLDRGNYRAFLMEDFPDGLNAIMKFKLICDYSDHVIGVCEHDQGGFQLELGMIVAMMDLFDDCFLLKRKYPRELEREKYNWMLDAGVFDMFGYKDRLYEWQDVDEFEAQSEALLSDVL